MGMRAIVMKRDRVTKRNPIAKALKFFTPQVIRDKTKYRRQDVKIRKGNVWKWLRD